MYLNQSISLTKTSPGGAVWSGITLPYIVRLRLFCSRRGPYILLYYEEQTYEKHQNN